MPHWATAVWAGWQPASSTRWPRWNCLPGATACAMNTACSLSRSSTAPRSNTPTPGSSTARLGNSRVPARCFRCALAAPPSTTANGPNGTPPRRSRRAPSTMSFRATAPTASAPCACGRPAPRRRSTSMPSTRATMPAPPNSRTGSRTSPGCCIRTTAPRPDANCACARNTFSSPLHCRTSCSTILRNTATSTTSPIRSPSTSTTRTRRSASPS